MFDGKAALSAALAACVFIFAGCRSEEYDWVIKIDGWEVDRDTYVTAQLKSSIDAVSSGEEERDIDGMTVDYLKEYHYIQDQFRERGLRIDSDSRNIISEFSREGWQSISSVYESNGLDRDDYTDYLTYLYKEQLVFNDIYMPGGEKGVSRRDLDGYLSENLCSLRAFTVPKINDDGSPLTEEQQKRLSDIVADAGEKLRNGEGIDRVAGRCLSRAGPLLGSEQDYSDGAAFVARGYMSLSSAGFPEELINRVFALPTGDSRVFDAGDYYYIYQKLPLDSDESGYKNLCRNALNTLKGREFQQRIARRCRNMEVVKNPRAIKDLPADRIKMPF